MSILIKPIVTEKTNAISELQNKYSFVVEKSANKVEIKKAVEANYGVNVESVNTIIVPAKSKVKYTKAGVVRGKTSSYKKAVVEVRSGEIIDIYNNI